jgi:Icc-related predicted phosphoesterase
MSDVHGSQACFMKFLNAANFYRADALVPGGDITGKMIVPIVDRLTGLAPTSFQFIELPNDSRTRNSRG